MVAVYLFELKLEKKISCKVTDFALFKIEYMIFLNTI